MATTLPSTGRYLLANARVPVALCQDLALRAADAAQGLASVDLTVADGCFVPTDPGVSDIIIDLQGQLVLPTFVDMHTHLDKAYTVERTGLPRNGLAEAVRLALADAPNRSAADLSHRMELALTSAYAHGTSAMRTHLDLPGLPADSLSWQVFAAKREAWRDRITLQAVALMAIERADDANFTERCAQIAQANGIAGAFIVPGAATPDRLDRFLAGASQHGLDVDFHVDETLDPAANGLGAIAEAVLRTGYRGRVVCGHCCALLSKSPEDTLHIIELVRRAGLHIVSLPLTNMFLMDRAAGTTPRRRGVTLVQELQAAGIAVSFASDNVRDAFFPHGDFDMLEVGRTAVRTTHLEAELPAWIDALFGRPAEAMGLSGVGRFRLGGPADAIIFRARSWIDLFARPHADRVVLRAGIPIEPNLATLQDLPVALETT